MKKLLVTLIVSLVFSGSIFAQHPDTYWPGFDYHAFDDQAPLYASLMINGEPVDVNYPDWEVMEVAAFVGDELRMTAMFLTDEYLEYGELFPTLNAEPIYYNYDGTGQEVSFKMYNHATGVLYEVCEPVIWDGDPIAILTGEEHWEGFDDPDHPLMLNFIGSEPQEVLWGDEWSSAPAITDDVVIGDDIVIIPAGYTAYANSVNITGNGRIIIEDGGFFYHNTEVFVDQELDVNGYGDPTGRDGNNAGYRLIAPSVHSTATNNVIPVEGTGLNQGTFDLYYFDESVTDNLPWINYKAQGGGIGFEDLDLGTGYLYANEVTKNAVLRGYTIPTDENYALTTGLTYTGGTEFAGWNLVGNPYTCNAYVKNGAGYVPYYQMNTTGDGINPTVVAAGTAIAPLKGIFVKATEEDLACIFTTAESSKGSNLNISVNQANAMVDNAIISFGYGSTLEKLQFNPNHTKVYMPVEGKDYAVVKADNQGEMPVSFKAQENGTYTLDFNAQNVEFSYLHLIDNLTGNDVDLLDNPSYSFDANTTDYTSRFKLVFATGANSNESNFGFISNGNLMILGIEGEATLQIVDVTGRILSTETFSGSYSKAINEATGVYMLRLIQGNDVKTQKIVVK